MDDIKVGDTVRSFDFYSRDIEGNQACYVQGEVEEIGRGFFPGQSCDCYKIKCTKKVFAGEVQEKREEYYFAPVNGTPKMIGKNCDGVVKL